MQGVIFTPLAKTIVEVGIVQMTKKELIQQYREGILKDNALHCPSVFDAYVIVECTDEWVFGFYNYSDTQTFFKVKLHDAADGDKFFTVQQVYLKLSMFLKVRALV